MSSTARIDLRLEAENKQLIEQAARLLATSVSDFTTSAALERARQVLLDHQTILVGQQAFEQLLDKLEHPPKVLPDLARQLGKAKKPKGKVG